VLYGFAAKASHLAGGELTYKHVSAKIYDIEVTIYRDCNDCKLSGTGGGTSTKNCNDLDEVFIRTISSSCGNKKIGSISLAKIGYENITPLCSSSKSKCDNNSNYNYGFEAHYYRGRINFENYTEYTGCMFQIFFHKSERSSNITNQNTEEDDLYNFALINPWVASVSSPQFTESPKILYNLYQSVYLSDGVVSQSGDSIACTWGIPYSNYNASISYKSNYSPNKFFSTYCPNGNNCASNPYASIPEGLYLNEETGDFTCTPTGNNETSTRVLEVEQWRTINGSAVLVGKVRRDVLTIIIGENTNNAPLITTNNTFTICEGQDFDLNLNINDFPLTTGTSTQKQDSINIDISSSILDLVVSNTTSSIPPYKKANISYSSKVGDEGIYYIKIKATDNYCPEVASSYKTIKLIIKKAPQLTFSVTDLFCGNNLINLKADRNGTFSTIVKGNKGDTIFNNIGFSGTEQFYYDKTESLNYNLVFSDTFGCVATIDTTVSNLGKSNIANASISGPISVCENLILKLKLTHPELNITDVSWVNQTSILGTTQEITSNPFNGMLYVNYSLKKDNLGCKFQDSVDITTLKITPITANEIGSYCYADVYSLAEFNISPKGGKWNAALPIEDENVFLQQIGNKDTFFDVKYIYTNLDGCESTMSTKISVLKSPIIKLANEAVCGDSYEYRLRNSVELPYNHSAENITWKIINKPEALILNPWPALDIPTYGIGIYEVEAVNTYSNGCMVKDTGIITVDKGLELTTNNKTTLCQQGEAINLETYLDINAAQGGWNSFTAGNLLNTRMFTPSKCGKYDFLYTYDKNGCFDELALELDVICKPTFNLQLPAAICSDYENINLPNQGRWEGRGVSQNSFSPSGLISWTYLRNIQEVDACIFDTFLPIEVVEPLTLEIGTLPKQLCEGQTLDLTILASDISKLETLNCGGTISLTSNKLTYKPALCDLQEGSIKLSLNQTSDALCSTINKELNIPYYALPKVSLPDASKACWPFTIRQTLNLNEVVSNAHFKINSTKSSFEDFGETLIYTFPASGNYNVEVATSSINGCNNTQLFENQYILHPKPLASFIAGDKKELSLSERDVYFSNNSELPNGKLTYEWFWTKNSQTELFSTYQNPYYTFPADTGNFKITLIANSEKGCSDTASENIWIVPDIRVFIPNAFTPDGKGPPQNSKFNIVSSNVQTFHIQIYNKWGQMVFQSNDISYSWDGTFGEKICQSGVYVYSIKLVNQSGLEYSYQGTVSLVR
jgi:gliding motility-associated-like protein